QQHVRPTAANEVLAGVHAQSAGAVAGTDLPYDATVSGALEEQPGTALGKFDPRTPGSIRIDGREHDSALAAHLVPEGRVLHARQRAARSAQGRLVSVAVRLVQRDPAVAVLVRRAEQSRGERVREEAALDVVGFLAVLGCRAGSEENRSFARDALAEADVERRNGRPALHSCERAG